ncbi:potassium transporter TrkG [Gaetbulibacter sp. M235]|uniref:TrkH family potassium uptake protein n=1 Tax=Gaetbulibacter sp. M235 TaxID=3126510 RepID=UPI00374E3395
MKLNLKLFYAVAFLISLFGVLVFLADFGFVQTERSQYLLNGFYFIVLIVGIVATVLRYLENKNQYKNKQKVLVFDIVTVVLSFVIILIHFLEVDSEKNASLFYNDLWIKFAIILTFIREFAELRFNFKRTVLNPAQLFILSFLFIIFLGTLLLMLPKATYNGISFINALFTSTSAVCVTGLIVEDTGTYFTLFGQSIILVLIQLGGLGILTFTSYFSYFFKGGSTYENQLALSDMNSSQKLGEVFSTLKYVLLITFYIETFSAISIYLSLNDSLFKSHGEQIYFSVFHSISAFCNAGFSTLTNSLFETGFKYNYYLQLVIIITFVLGGLGFPIVVNILNYLKYKISLLINFSKLKQTYKPWVLNLNSRITLITTLTLSLVGFIVFYILEYNNTLAEHSGFGKIVTALFGATTPRTAGFNTVEMTTLAFPTLMMILLLMWVGASPSSTGGGIKTSTFAIATLNILSLAKGKSRIEVYRREIADISVRRAFAIISLSLIVIGMGIMLISVFDNEKGLMNIAFECFSAYSTVGLSLGITGSLSMVSKFILIGIMIVGRVGMLSIVIAIFNKVKHKNYRYPTEEITIN